MAKSKKNRKTGAKRIDAVTRLLMSRRDKAQGEAQREMLLIKFRNALPLGHELNRHKIETTFTPIERVLDAIEERGEINATASGEAGLWDEHFEEYIPLAPVLRNTCTLYQLAAEKFGWKDPQVKPMIALADRLDAGKALYKSDITGTRRCIAWMRSVIVNVTPNQWEELRNEAIAREELEGVEVKGEGEE